MARFVFDVPDEDLRRRFKAKLIMEGLTAKEWIVERIKEYLGEKGGEKHGVRKKKAG